MQTETFVDQVMTHGPQMDRDRALNATHVTLRALCEHLPAEQTRRMSAQLPETLSKAADAGALEAGKDGIHVNDLENFYTKVASRGELSRDEARGISRAVARTLKHAVSGGELVDVTIDLPAEMAELVAYS
jgi:uncharacterized protein (DUF2267 family)